VIVTQQKRVYTVFYKKDPFCFFIIYSNDDQLTAPVETIKLVPVTHYDVSITSRLTKNLQTKKQRNCHILLQYFELVFLRLQPVKILCKLIII